MPNCRLDIAPKTSQQMPRAEQVAWVRTGITTHQELENRLQRQLRRGEHAKTTSPHQWSRSLLPELKSIDIFDVFRGRRTFEVFHGRLLCRTNLFRRL